MSIETKPLSDITTEVIRVLYKEIGTVNTIRFLNQFGSGFGNYTEERERLFQGKTLPQIVSEIKQANNENKFS